MTQLQQIRQEIERRKKALEDASYAGPIQAEIHRVYRELLSFLNTLSEEPDKSLEEEIETWIPAHISIGTDKILPINPTELANVCKEWGKSIARHFAKWQKSQMLKEAVEGEVENASFGMVYLRKNLTNDGYSTGDKVRIIVLKEEEE